MKQNRSQPSFCWIVDLIHGTQHPNVSQRVQTRDSEICDSLMLTCGHTGVVASHTAISSGRDILAEVDQLAWCQQRLGMMTSRSSGVQLSLIT